MNKLLLMTTNYQRGGGRVSGGRRRSFINGYGVPMCEVWSMTRFTVPDPFTYTYLKIFLEISVRIRAQ